MSVIRLHDSVQFFPFDPIRKEIHVRNAPLEGPWSRISAGTTGSGCPAGPPAWS